MSIRFPGAIVGVLLAVSVVTAADESSAVAARSPATMPAWFVAHLEYMVREGGVWRAENAAYRSDAEPADAYGTEWHYGIGRKSITGRLFGIVDGEETATYWEFRLAWHAASGRAIFHQFGADGTVGLGEMSLLEDGRLRVELEFSTPSGVTWRFRDEAEEVGDDTHATASFDHEGGAWVKKREYTWDRVDGDD